MSPKTIRFLFFIVLLAHGIGHYMGMSTAVGVNLSKTTSYKSWLLGGILNDWVSRILCFILYAAAFVGIIVAAFSFKGWIFPNEWWQPLTLYASIISLISVVVFWNGLATTFNKVGALGVSLFTIVSLIWWRFPSEIFND